MVARILQLAQMIALLEQPQDMSLLDRIQKADVSQGGVEIAVGEAQLGLPDLDVPTLLDALPSVVWAFTLTAFTSSVGS